MKIVVGTRASKLALAQTKIVVDQLLLQFPNIQFEVKEIVTTGDKILDVSLDKIGGKGLFLKEIEDALLKKEIDIAVHSMKDVPAFLPDGLIIASVLKREDSRDCLISSKYSNLESLPSGAVVGTSSARRRVQLMIKRPDLNFKVLRGNVLTRLKKVENGEFDAAVMAYAGLKRLGLSNVVKEIFSKEFLIPAIAQGAICIECREQDSEIIKILKTINDHVTELETTAERAYLQGINGDCSTPIGAMANVSSNGVISLKVWYGDYDAKFEHFYECSGEDSNAIGAKAAIEIKKMYA